MPKLADFSYHITFRGLDQIFCIARSKDGPVLIQPGWKATGKPDRNQKPPFFIWKGGSLGATLSQNILALIFSNVSGAGRSRDSSRRFSGVSGIS